MLFTLRERYITILWSREGNDEWYGEKDRKNNGSYAESPFLRTYNSIVLVNTTFVQSCVTVSWNKESPEEWSSVHTFPILKHEKRVEFVLATLRMLFIISNEIYIYISRGTNIIEYWRSRWNV